MHMCVCVRVYVCECRWVRKIIHLPLDQKHVDHPKILHTDTHTHTHIHIQPQALMHGHNLARHTRGHTQVDVLTVGAPMWGDKNMIDATSRLVNQRNIVYVGDGAGGMYVYVCERERERERKSKREEVEEERDEEGRRAEGGEGRNERPGGGTVGRDNFVIFPLFHFFLLSSCVYAHES